MTNVWNQVYWGNSVKDWAIALGIAIITFIFIHLFRAFIIKQFRRWAQRTTTKIDDFVLKVLEKFLLPFLYIAGFYFAISYLHLSARVNNIIKTATLLVCTFFILRIITAVVQYFIIAILNKNSDSDVKQRQARGLLVIINATIWALGIVFLLDNLGYNVTTIIAGLGIGGIAIALAAQTILGDLFSYFVILFDRPFEIGDFIIVDNKMGTVEYIGVKTTRLTTLSGEQLIFSNKDLTDSRVHNYKRMAKRRVVFSLGVVYQTTYAQLQAIPGMVKNIIEKQEDIQFDRGHFSGYGDSSLNFEFVYYVLSSDYNRYMDIQQVIYLAIFEAFAKQGIDFAYPTRTLFIAGNQTEEKKAITAE